jgi:arsenite/tail-anchored protein-transporting ATPase
VCGSAALSLDITGRHSGRAANAGSSYYFKTFMRALLEHQVLFFGGKGGVGKTTCSAACALAASRAGRRVLLVSTDPAHSTSDVFETSIGGAERGLQPGLSAVEIDGEQEAARYVEQVKRDIAAIFSPGVVRQATRQIDLAAASPGLAEVALLDRIVDLINDRQDAHDLIVFDTAPTGHTLQLLRMPDAMTTWIDALVRHRRAMLAIDEGGVNEAAAVPDRDPVVTALERRRARLAALRACVTDRSRTAFVLVTIAERLAIEETARAEQLLADTGVNVGALIVNRLLPDGLGGTFYAARKAQEREYTDEIDQRFRHLPRILVRQLERDVHGLSALARISEQLM